MAFEGHSIYKRAVFIGALYLAIFISAVFIGARYLAVFISAVFIGALEGEAGRAGSSDWDLSGRLDPPDAAGSGCGRPPPVSSIGARWRERPLQMYGDVATLPTIGAR